MTINSAGGGHPLAIVTGASTGIGFELARIAARNGHDLLIAADEFSIHAAAEDLRQLGVEVQAIEADLSTISGVNALVKAVGARNVDVLFANAGRGLGHDFLHQSFGEWQRVIDTNITGTLRLIQVIAQQMSARGQGKILVTGSISGLIPGSYQAVYNGTKAFLDSFSIALRYELKDSGVSVTCLMPGATDTEFFRRADMLDTKVGTMKKQDPREVAQTGYSAMMEGDEKVVAGWKNKIQAFMTNVLPDATLAEMHSKQAAPGTANQY
jgi:uncharacterized protein